MRNAWAPVPNRMLHRLLDRVSAVKQQAGLTLRATQLLIHKAKLRLRIKFGGAALPCKFLQLLPAAMRLVPLAGAVTMAVIAYGVPFDGVVTAAFPHEISHQGNRCLA